MWASTVGTAIKAPDGELTHIVSHFRDVTEQRVAEQQLFASEENLREIAAVARQVSSQQSPRQAICDAAALIAGADIVQLWEPDGADGLLVTAATGIALAGDLRLPLTGESSATVIAYHRRERGICLDLHAPDALTSVRLRDASASPRRWVSPRPGVMEHSVCWW